VNTYCAEIAYMRNFREIFDMFDYDGKRSPLFEFALPNQRMKYSLLENRMSFYQVMEKRTMRGLTSFTAFSSSFSSALPQSVPPSSFLEASSFLPLALSSSSYFR